jgi:type III secretion protein L
MKSPVVKKPFLKESLLGISGTVVKKPLRDAYYEAEEILAKAKSEAARIVETAQAEAESVRAAAYDEGRERALTELTQCILDARAKRERMISEIEEEVITLSFKIAEKIIARQIERDDSALMDIIASALYTVRTAQRLAIHVNPSDMSTVEKYRDRLIAVQAGRLFDFIPNPAIAPHGCLIETDLAKVDAQLETQLRVLERCLLERAESPSEGWDAP